MPETNNNVYDDPLKINKEYQKARTAICVGECGSGKSILSLQLASEVARKGGIAWYMPLEQTIEECMYILESFNAISQNNDFKLATSIPSALAAIHDWDENNGCLIILKPIKQNYKDFLETLEDNSKLLANVGLKLIIVDPLNSINNSVKIDYVEQRDLTLNILNNMKSIGINILLNIEISNSNISTDKNDNALLNKYEFIETIAETIIKLKVEKTNNYAHRIFEIKKSRSQRELRGEHTFSIVPSEGIHIYPSSAAVSAKIQNLRDSFKNCSLKYGLDSIDNIIGNKAIYDGDIITFHGPNGTYKSQLGYYFLLTARKPYSNHSKKTLAILFDSKESISSIKFMISDINSENRKQNLKNNKDNYIYLDPDKDVRVVSFPHGNVTPGKIYQIIKHEIMSARLEGYIVERIMIDNISQWESASYVVNDSLFPSTFIEFLKKLNVTCLLVCNKNSNSKGQTLQDLIIDNSDCQIQFDRFEFRGLNRALIKVMKSRGLKHRRESFAIQKIDNEIVVMPHSSLLRYHSTDDTATPIKTRFLFHVESKVQSEYYNSLCNSYKAVLSENTEIDYQDRIYLNKAMNIGHYSAVDELQILQLDEFQLSNNKTSDNIPNQPLYKYQLDKFYDIKFDEYFEKHINENTVQFDNKKNIIGIFSYRNDYYKLHPPRCWSDLASECIDWEKKHILNKFKLKKHFELYFDFPKVSSENYNCLFFEILLSYLDVPIFDNASCPVRSWLISKECIKSLMIFYTLCKKSYELREEDDRVLAPIQKDSVLSPYNVNPKSITYRHWYTTLNQMFSNLTKTDLLKFSVLPLPNNISISGEWYLGITSYSAAPDAGFELLKLMTTKDAELNRVRLGVGLPTRSCYYQCSENDISISPYFSFNLKILEEIIKHSFRRSNFQCYNQLSSVLYFHLKKILEMDLNISMKNIMGGSNTVIEGVIDELISKLNFLQQSKYCKSNGKLVFNNIECEKCRGLFRKP